MASPPKKSLPKKSLSKLTKEISPEANFILPENLNSADFKKVKAKSMLKFLDAVFKSSLSTKNVERCLDFAEHLNLGSSRVAFNEVKPFIIENLTKESSKNKEAAVLGLFKIFVKKHNANQSLPLKDKEEIEELFNCEEFKSFFQKLLPKDKRNRRQSEMLGEILFFCETYKMNLNLIDNIQETKEIKKWYAVRKNNLSEALLIELLNLSGAEGKQIITNKTLKCNNVLIAGSGVTDTLQLENAVNEVLKAGISGVDEAKERVGRILHSLKEKGITVIFEDDEALNKQVASLLKKYKDNLDSIHNKLLSLEEISSQDYQARVGNALKKGIGISFRERFKAPDRVSIYCPATRVVTGWKEQESEFGFDEWTIFGHPSSTLSVTIDNLAEKLFSIQEGGIIIEFTDKELNAQAQELQKRGEKNYNDRMSKTPSARVEVNSADQWTSTSGDMPEYGQSRV